VSQENVEVVRRVYEAAANRDSASVLSLYDPDVEIDVSRTHGAVMEDLYAGAEHEGLRKWSREWHDVWEQIDYEVDELIDAGDDVIGVVTVRGRGRGSGAEVEFKLHAGLWTVRNGKIVRVVWFKTRGEALEAAGLRE
jgi:ketosteroid isomerase-like protein